MPKLVITQHALDRYSLRRYGSSVYHISHDEVRREITSDLNQAEELKGEDIPEFIIARMKRNYSGDLKIFKRNDLFFLIVDDSKRKTLITVLDDPNQSKISDFFQRIKKDKNNI